MRFPYNNQKQIHYNERLESMKMESKIKYILLGNVDETEVRKMAQDQEDFKQDQSKANMESTTEEPIEEAETRTYTHKKYNRKSCKPIRKKKPFKLDKLSFIVKNVGGEI